MRTSFTLRVMDRPDSFDWERFEQMLPSDMTLEHKNEDTWLHVRSEKEHDVATEYFVQRELDRVYFLTLVRIAAYMFTGRVHADLNLRSTILGTLPPTIGPIGWTSPLTLQLRLWSLADNVEDPLMKILLLYQIIELRYSKESDFPTYINSSIPPHPLSESKFVRHLAVHAGDVNAQQLQKYCDYLGYPRVMLDRTDATFVALVASKVKLIKKEAFSVINVALQADEVSSSIR